MFAWGSIRDRFLFVIIYFASFYWPTLEFDVKLLYTQACPTSAGLIPRLFVQLGYEMDMQYWIIHVWQSRIEIEYYSIMYFEHTTKFEVL